MRSVRSSVPFRPSSGGIWDAGAGLAVRAKFEIHANCVVVQATGTAVDRLENRNATLSSATWHATS